MTSAAFPLSPRDGTALAVTLLCIAGAWFGISTLDKLQATIPSLEHSFAGWWLAAAGLIGAGAATYSVFDRFGRSGRRGLLRAIIGGISATLMLGIVAGTLILPVYGTMFGPWLMVLSVFQGDTAYLPWIVGLIGLHRARRGARPI